MPPVIKNITIKNLLYHIIVIILVGFISFLGFIDSWGLKEFINSLNPSGQKSLFCINLLSFSDFATSRIAINRVAFADIVIRGLCFTAFYLVIAFFYKKLRGCLSAKFENRNLKINIDNLFSKLKWVLPAILALFIFIDLMQYKQAFKIPVNQAYFSQAENTIVLSEPIQHVEININTFNKNLPEDKDHTLPVLIAIDINDAVIISYGNIAVQGTSTAYFPKKNWSLRFYADLRYQNELGLKVGDSVVSKKWIVKADWVDPSQLRNALSYKLWADMVASRSVEPKLEVDHAFSKNANGTQFISPVTAGAQGFPRTHPALVKVNREHYGIGLLLLGHEPNNFNIDKSNPNHIYLDFDARDGEFPNKSWENFSAKSIGKNVESRVPKEGDLTDKQREAIDSLGKFINSDLSTFHSQFDQYFDKTNMIDSLLFLEMIYDYDAVAQDIEIVSYDLKKWYFLPWDKDTTFGMLFKGTGFIKGSENQLVIDYSNERPSETPWFKTYWAFQSEVEARYAQLRNEGIFSAEHIAETANEIHHLIPEEAWEAEKTKWDPLGRPTLDGSGLDQIVEWVQKRLEMMDEHFNYVPVRNKN